MVIVYQYKITNQITIWMLDSFQIKSILVTTYISKKKKKKLSYIILTILRAFLVL